MWTFTYAGSGVFDREQVMGDVAAFVRRLRSDLGDELAYIHVPELHPGGHGWHVHMLVGRRIEHRDVTRLWGHGIVWVEKFNRGRVGARTAGLYAAKYLEKDLGDGFAGVHRYEVGQGFRPGTITVPFPTLAAARSALVHHFGSSPAVSLSSASWVDYRGPPVYWECWS